MSHHSSLDKRLARLKKMQRRKLPVFFDLVDWLKLHRYAQTTGEANRLILAGRVRSGSHTLGVTQVKVQQPDGKIEEVPTVMRVLSSRFKADMIVLDSA